MAQTDSTLEIQDQPSLIDVAVLDDDADFRNYIEDVLKDEGKYAVRTFGHPDRLLESEKPAPISSHKGEKGPLHI